jgi:transcriptional regulator with XRE-family HTH domain
MGDLIAIFAVRLRQLRNERGWTQEDLAHAVKLSPRYVGQMERQQASPSIRVLGRLAQALKVEPEDLLRRKRSTERAKV